MEQVSQGSAALAWWSADAESDSQPEEGRGKGRGRGRGVSQGMVGGGRGVSRVAGEWGGGVIALANRALRQLLVTCYGYRWQEPCKGN